MISRVVGIILIIGAFWPALFAYQVLSTLHAPPITPGSTIVHTTVVVGPFTLSGDSQIYGFIALAVLATLFLLGTGIFLFLTGPRRSASR